MRDPAAARISSLVVMHTPVTHVLVGSSIAQRVVHEHASPRLGTGEGAIRPARGRESRPRGRTRATSSAEVASGRAPRPRQRPPAGLRSRREARAGGAGAACRREGARAPGRALPSSASGSRVGCRDGQWARCNLRAPSIARCRRACKMEPGLSGRDCDARLRRASRAARAKLCHTVGQEAGRGTSYPSPLGGARCGDQAAARPPRPLPFAQLLPVRCRCRLWPSPPWSGGGRSAGRAGGRERNTRLAPTPARFSTDASLGTPRPRTGDHRTRGCRSRSALRRAAAPSTLARRAGSPARRGASRSAAARAVARAARLPSVPSRRGADAPSSASG